MKLKDKEEIFEALKALKEKSHKKRTYYIKTKTEERFNKVLEILDAFGFCWYSGDNLLEELDYYHSYKKDTIIIIKDSGVTYGEDIEEHYIKISYKGILELTQ
jgi:hypothetical protein